MMLYLLCSFIEKVIKVAFVDGPGTRKEDVCLVGVQGVDLFFGFTLHGKYTEFNFSEVVLYLN